jgi:hypothetical protein
MHLWIVSKKYKLKSNRLNTIFLAYLKTKRNLCIKRCHAPFVIKGHRYYGQRAWRESGLINVIGALVNNQLNIVSLIEETINNATFIVG